MTEVQVFEGAGPDFAQPLDEQGRKHGIWKQWTVRNNYTRNENGTTAYKERMRIEVTYEHGVQVDRPKSISEGRV